jgi:mRNA-degrading endonuclease RelE of RelBE toxin-antitoxin system
MKMQIARTDRFSKAWERLDEKHKILARKAILLMIEDLKYPSLGVKKMKGTRNIWEARASRSLRMTFQLIGNVIILRNIGHHDDTLNQP